MFATAKVKLIKIDCQTLVLCLVLLLLLQYYDWAKAHLRNKITWIIMAKKGLNCHRNASWILSDVILLIIEILTCIKLSVFGVIFDDLYTFRCQYTGHYEMTHRWNNILISAGHKIVGPMTICRLTKDADACRVLWLSEWSVSLLFPQYKDNLTLWPDDFVLISFF